MASGSVVLLTIVVLFAVLHTGTSFKCYVCGKSDGGCNDPFVKDDMKSYADDCKSDDKGCLKVDHPDDGDNWLRGCGKEADCTLYSDCYFCTGDLCNSSGKVVPSAIVIGIFSAFLGKLFI